ncbi:MAG: S8 family serine peptidase [Cyanobacteria bacterium P01_A01_bin.123]
MTEPSTITLQRGGEELLLIKLVDRFTTPGLSAALQQTLMNQIRPQNVTLVAAGRLLEWTVLPRHLESAMTQARQTAGVDFASHVYRLKASAQTLVYLTDELTVQFVPTVARHVITQLVQPLGLAQLEPITGIPNAIAFRITATAKDNPIKIANQLATLSQVMVAEPNIIIHSALTYRPQDPFYPNQWHLNHSGGQSLRANSHIFAESAWDITRGSRSVVVAISDDAFDLSHPDLQGAGKLVAPRDLKNRDGLPSPTDDNDNHGTAVSGLAIGEENGDGIVGVAPGCSWMPIQTTGFLDDRSIEQVFDWAVAQGAAVISCSWSPAATYFPLSRRQSLAINRAATQGRGGKGCVVLFSAGNANRPVQGDIAEKGWPQGALRGSTTWLNGFAVHPDVLVVSACTSLNQKAAYSNWGDQIAIAAPSNNGKPNMSLPQVGTVNTGPEINTSLPGRGMVTSDRSGDAGYSTNSYTSGFGGTSSACPVAAGVAALVLSANPELTAREVRQILQTTADKIVDNAPDPQLKLQYGTYDNNSHSRWFGYGKVNANKAVQAARQKRRDRRITQVFEAENLVAVTIPDDNRNGATSTISGTQNGTVQDIQIEVELAHDYLGDLSLSLIAPNGETVLLEGRTLGRQTQLQKIYSLATTPCLTSLLGHTANGPWRLKAIDHAPLNTGKILTWRLKLGI